MRYDINTQPCMNHFSLFVRFYTGRRKFLLVASIKMLKEILVKEFDTFTDREVSV